MLQWAGCSEYLQTSGFSQPRPPNSTATLCSHVCLPPLLAAARRTLRIVRKEQRLLSSSAPGGCHRASAGCAGCSRASGSWALSCEAQGPLSSAWPPQDQMARLASLENVS